MKRRKQRVIFQSPNVSATARQRLADIEKTTKQRQKEITWQNHKLSRKPSQNFQVHLLVYPLLHTQYSKSDQNRMLDVYKAKIREVIRNPNSILVLEKSSQGLDSGLEKEITPLIKENRVLMGLDNILIEQKIKNIKNIQLISQGEMMDDCVVRHTALLASYLNLKPNQIKFDLDEALLSAVSPTGKIYPRKVRSTRAFIIFRNNYGKIKKSEFNKIFYGDPKKQLVLKKQKYFGVNELYRDAGYLDKHGTIIKRPKWGKLAVFLKAWFNRIRKN